MCVQHSAKRAITYSHMEPSGFPETESRGQTSKTVLGRFCCVPGFSSIMHLEQAMICAARWGGWRSRHVSHDIGWGLKQPQTPSPASSCTMRGHMLRTHRWPIHSTCVYRAHESCSVVFLPVSEVLASSKPVTQSG